MVPAPPSSASSARAMWACPWRWSSKRPASRSAGSTSIRGRSMPSRRGESYIKHIGADRVAAAVARGRFTRHHRLRAAARRVTPSSSASRRRSAGIASPTCPTSTTRRRRSRRACGKGQLIVLESTTYPGTTDEEVLPILEATGLHVPCGLPARVLARARGPGQPAVQHEDHPQGRRAASTPTSTEAAVALYSAAIDKVVPVSSARVAESCKLLENVYRSINIALVNELKVTFDRMGIDVWEVIEAAKTKPFGFTPFYPGPGAGRPLHPARPVLPVVEGVGARRCGRGSSSSPARSTRRCRATCSRRSRPR